MSRIYQRKTKSKTNSKVNNPNHEENEKVGMSYPAVGVSYGNNVSQLKAKEGNEETKDIIQLQNATSKIYNPLLSLNNYFQTPNQSKNPCLSKLFQKHNYIITNTKKHEKLINEGKSGKINFWYFNGQKPTTIEFIETQFLLSSEKEQYDKLSISCPDNESDPSFLKYLNLIEVLEPKIKLYDDIQAEKDRIDKQAEVDIDNIYIYGINRDLDNLFRSLQFSFPRRDKTREIFLKKYNYSNYYKSLDSFIKDMTNGGSGINWSMAQAYLNVGKLRPCDKFYIAVKGPGTDEGNMFFAMKEAHEYGIGKLDEDLREEYPDFNYGKSGLPHTGAGNDIWTVAAWIDSETSYGTDDRIKAKALLSYGRVRPIDEVRMALMKDTSKTDLKNALRKANVENLEIILNENNDKCLTPVAEKKLVSDRLLDDYKFSYNSDLLGDIKRIHTSVNMSISGHITIPTSNSLYKVDEKGLNTANNIVFGNETKQEQYLDEKKYNKKLSISTFSYMSMEDKKIILDSMQSNLNNDKSKVEFNQLVGIWELEITDNPVYNIIKHNQLFDSNSFDNFVKYNLKIEQSKKLLKILSSDKEIGGIGLNIYNYLNTYLLKNSKLLWTYHYIGIDNLETAEKEMFQLVVNSKDKNWQTNYIMNVLSPEEKNYYKYYWKDLKYDSLKDAQTKDNFDHIKGLLNDDPTVRINAERKLLTKANSGLGASITNIGSTAGLSAKNEQRELEVDLEMAKWNDGKIDKNEMAGLEKDILDAKETRENFEETRDTVENVATMIAQTLVTVLATVLIPGAGGLIAQAIINGIASAGTNWVMKGDRYSLKGGFSDLINGGISGAMGVIGNASVLKLAKGEGTFAALLKNSKLIREGVENSIGSSHEVLIDAIDGKGPEEIFKNHMKSIGTGIIIGNVTKKIENAIKGNGSVKGDQTTDSTETRALPEGSTGESYDVKHPNDWTEEDFITFLREVGNWDDAIDQLKLVGGDNLAFRLHKIRSNIQNDFIADGAAPLENASNDIKSDVDLNIEGKNAGRKQLEFEARMKKLYGDTYKDMFKLEFFLEKYRLGQYRDLLGEVSPEEYSSIVDDINLTQETYQYAKMLRHAQSDPTQLARIEGIITGRADVDQIRKLSKLNEGDIQKLRERALLESDGLVRRYNKPNLDPKEKQRLAILISKKQAEINFYSKDAYISFGAMDKTITSPKELKGALLSQLEMIHAKIDSYKGIGEASMGYEIYKYISRYTLALEAAGIKISPKMKLFQELSIGIQTADLGNRKMYDVYAQNRELKHRALVMDTFLDEAHQILALQDWNQIDIANIKAVIESLQVSVGDSVTDADSTIESTPNSQHLSSETKLPTWDDDKTPPMGTKIPKEETPTWDDDKTPPMGTKTPKEETPTWDDDKTPPMGTKIPKEETPTWDDDKTPPLGTKTPKDGDRLITSNQENVYHVQDSSEQRFQADARIDDEGVLTITMRTELEDGTRSKLLKGKEQYDKILQYFGDRIKKIKGSWQYGSNLQKFLEIKSEGKSDEEAALGTWSGQQAKKNDFIKAQVLSIQKDSNGKIIKIEVYFYK